MYRLGRCLLNGLTVLSLLLCVATATAWYGSYHGGRILCYAPDDLRYAAVASDSGQLTFTWMEHIPEGRSSLGWSIARRGWLSPPVSWRGHLTTFEAESSVMAKGRDWELRVPHWSVMACAVVLPAAWALRRCRRAVPDGHCASCRYDLTGNVSGVCPECGNAMVGEA